MCKSLLVTLMLTSLLCGCSGSSSDSQPVSLTAITVAPSSATMAPGTTSRFTATGRNSQGGLVDLTASVTWSSSDTGVATVSNAAGSKGLATAVSIGSATISAITGTVSGSALLTTAAVQSITVTPINAVSLVGTTLQFTARGNFSSGAPSQDLTNQLVWNTSDPAIATVSEKGVTTAVSAGPPVTVTATARSGEAAGSASLTVVALLSVTLAPVDPTIQVGAVQQFNATGNLSNGTTMEVGSQASWSSADPALLSIDASGKATALSPGSTTVSASFTGVAAQPMPVTVQGPTIIAVTPAAAGAVVGSTRQFTATGTFADGSTRDLTAFVTWSSSPTGAAVISNAAGSKGLAEAVANGTTVITATLGAVQGSASLSVRTLSSLSITPASSSIAIGSSAQLTATGIFPDGATQDLTSSANWTSSAPGIASVSNDAGTRGLVTANGAGSTTITGSFAGLSSTGTVTVTQAAVSSDRAFVTNFGSDTLAVIDTVGNRVLTSIPVGSGPRGVAVHPSAGRAYVANSNSNTVSVIDIAGNAPVATVNVGSGPWGVAVNPAANRVYVANSLSGTLSVIDTTGNTVIATVAVGSAPRGVAVNAARNLVYVTNFAANTVSVVNSLNNTLAGIINVGLAPLDVAVNSAANLIYVANSFSGLLSVINGANNAVTPVLVGSNAQGVAVHPAANRAYLTLGATGSLVVIDTASNGVVTTIPVESDPQGVAVKPASNRVFVANTGSNTVSVVDSTTNSLIATIPGLAAPTDIAVIP